MKRDEDFTGPAIGILGATQLNGGAVGTADRPRLRSRSLLRTAYEYFRAPRRRPLGPGLVGDHVLQRLVHGRQRRSPDLVLLQLGIHLPADADPPLDRQPIRSLFGFGT